MTKQENYKVNDYSRLNLISRRKIAFSIKQLLHPEVTTNPSLLSLHLLLFPFRAKKGRKPHPEKACCACVMRLLHSYVFPARFPPSINTASGGHPPSSHLPQQGLVYHLGPEIPFFLEEMLKGAAEYVWVTVLCLTPTLKSPCTTLWQGGIQEK